MFFFTCFKSFQFSCGLLTSKVKTLTVRSVFLLDSGKDSEIATSTTVKFTTRKSTTEPTIKPTLKINIWATKEEVKTSEGTLTTASNNHEHDGSS